MAHGGHRVDREKISCSLCLDLLQDPVTAACGHSYCRSCVKDHWDTEDQRRVYSCPQCRQTFRPRPDLKKNTMLAELVEGLKKTGLQAAPADHCYAGAEDVACDVCTGRKLKAQRSCLQCLASFCEEHLQPHFHAAPFKKHRLVEPSKKLQENICSVHDEVMKMFCRTDQQSICYLCSVDQHTGHDTVSAAAERTERQRELQGSRQNIQQKIQLRGRDVKLLQQVRFLQQTAMSRARELQEELEQEITELRRKDQGLEKLSRTQDHHLFLQDYPSLSRLREPPDSPSISERPLRDFEDVTAAVAALRDKLQDVLRGTWTNISETGTQVDVLLPELDPEPQPQSQPDPDPDPEPEPEPEPELDPEPQPQPEPDPDPEPEPEPDPDPDPEPQPQPQPDPDPEPQPRTRAEFLRYSRDIRLDPNTAHRRLLLFELNRGVTLTTQVYLYPAHPDRFTADRQVLSKEGLTGRCYWEVELRGDVGVAVSYRTVSRSGQSGECMFGWNNKSWALYCKKDHYVFMHNKIHTYVSGPRSSRLGVYLDHRAGLLSFYSISKTMTPVTRVQTTFTEPLHAGLWLYFSVGDSAKLCKLN